MNLKGEVNMVNVRSKKTITSILLIIICSSAFVVTLSIVQFRKIENILDLGTDDLIRADSKIIEDEIISADCDGLYKISNTTINKIEDPLKKITEISEKHKIYDSHIYLTGNTSGYFQVRNGFFTVNNIISNIGINISIGTFIILRQIDFVSIYFTENYDWIINSTSNATIVIFYPKFIEDYSVFIVNIDNFLLDEAINSGQFDKYYNTLVVGYLLSDLNDNIVNDISRQIWNNVFSLKQAYAIVYPVIGKPYLKFTQDYEILGGYINYFSWGYYVSIQGINNILKNYDIELKQNEFIILESGIYYTPKFYWLNFDPMYPQYKTYGYAGDAGPNLGSTVIFRPQGAGINEVWIMARWYFDYTIALSYFSSNLVIPIEISDGHAQLITC